MRIILNIALLVCAAGVVWLIDAQLIVFGSHAGNYYEGYGHAFTWDAFFLGAGLSIAAVALLHLSLRVENEAMLLVAWSLFGWIGQLLSHQLSTWRLGALVTHPANGFYEASRFFSASEFLRRFHEVTTPTANIHVHDNLPGKVLLYDALRLLTDNPTILGLLILGLYAFGGIPLYFIAKAVLRDRRTALYAFALYLFTPAVACFAPLLNILTAVPLLGCLLLAIYFAQEPRSWVAVALGVGLYATALFDPEALFLGFFFVFALWRVSVQDLKRLAQGAAVGFLSIDTAMRLLMHFDLIGALEDGLSRLHEFNAGVLPPRPYDVWVWADPLEFFLSSGVLISILCALRLTSPGTGRTLLLTLLATVAILDLSGLVRGEITRQWIFMMPLMQLVAADACADAWTASIALAASIMQTAVTVQTVGFIG